jgi:nitroreductase
VDISTPVSEVIRERTSRRTYLTEPFTKEVRDNIEQKISEISRGKLGTPITFKLVSLKDATNENLKLGTYGFIRGGRYFIAGQIRSSKEGFLDYGCQLETLILELTRLGLGTCWLGGTFDRGEFAKAITLKPGYVIPAITPVGFATSSRGVRDRLIRLGAGSNNRLPQEQLFFDQESSKPLVVNEQDPVYQILDSVRRAPSASNNQPWRIIKTGNRFDFHISRKPGYQKAFSGIDLQMVDMGIAMAHFDLVSHENRKNPSWRISEGTPSPEGWEYVISVHLQA